MVGYKIPTDNDATGGSEITYRPPRGLFQDIIMQATATVSDAA